MAGLDGAFELGQHTSAAAGAMTATLAAVQGETTWMTGFYVDGLGATAGSVIDVTITGLLGGTMTMKVTIPAGATVALTDRLRFLNLPRPIPASGPNQAIVLNVPSFGAGNTQALCGITGFHLP
jgi:hypothetical protein